MDCHSVNVYKEEGILTPFLYTAHLDFLVICAHSMFTLPYKKILQVYCLDCVSSGITAVLPPCVVANDEASTVVVTSVVVVGSVVYIVVADSTVVVVTVPLVMLLPVSYTHLTLPTTPYV